MLQLRLTRKVQAEIGLKPTDLAGLKDSDSVLGNWFVNLFTLDRKKTLIFLNDKTLYSFILYGVKKSNIPNIAEIFKRGFAQALAFEGLNEQNITNALSGYEEYEFTKTNSPKVLGNMNDLVDLYKHFILSKGGLKHCDLTEITMKTNRTPQKNIEWAYSIDRLKELLGVKK